jgi:copper chaperone NosL
MFRQVQLMLQIRKNIRSIIVICCMAVYMISSGSTSHLYAMEHDQRAMKDIKKAPDIEHPMMNPEIYSTKKRCPNCGMMINMWARTRHSFTHPEGDFTTCSIRCMADKAVNSGETPADGQVALYLEPDKMIPVEKASYVIGSSAKGTMTMKSKIAFENKQAAEKFAAAYGGQIVGFEGTFATATMELPKSRMMIDKKRKKTGKIKEPTEKDHCGVCGMYPARFPNHNSQIWAKSGKTIHFCSTKCLINFNAEPEKYIKEPVMAKMTWVTLYSNGMYESAFGPYYVVGSKVHGPMGAEALPFKAKKNAEEFAKIQGGKIVSFSQLTPKLIMENQ